MDAVSLGHGHLTLGLQWTRQAMSPRVGSALGRRGLWAYGPRMARRQPAVPRDNEHPDDRALDRLADRGPSRVGVEAAMRARDVSRPGPTQLRLAERTVTVRPARVIDP
jgi:hypothetical protein